MISVWFRTETFLSKDNTFTVDTLFHIFLTAKYFYHVFVERKGNETTSRLRKTLDVFLDKINLYDIHLTLVSRCAFH